MLCQAKDSDTPLIAKIMVKKTRLRVQKSRGRLVKTIFALVCVVGLSYWQAEKIRPVLSHIAGIFDFSSTDSALENKKRGVIYDRNFKELATSLESVSVYGLVREIDDPVKTAMKLAVVLEKDPEDIIQQLDTEDHRVWIAKNIDQVEEEGIKALGIPGIFLHSEVGRYYPEHKTAAHLLGFSEGNHGLAGVEYKYDLLLDTMATSIVEDSGLVTSAQATPLDGHGDYNNLVLTVDLKIQKLVEQFTEELARAIPGAAIGACMIEGKSGAIVGSANFPSYDPNFFRDYDSTILNNILLDPMVVPENFRAALREAVQLNSNYSDVDGKEILPWSVGSQDVNLGAELRMWGPLGLEQETVDFGFQATPVSKINVVKEVDRLDTGTVPVFASPIQIVSAFSSLINGGKKIVPYTMDRLVDEAGEYGVQVGDNSSGVQLLSPAVSSEVSRLFHSQANEGALGGMYLFGDSAQYSQTGYKRDYVGHQLVIAPIPFDKPEIVFLLVIKESGFGPEQKSNERMGKAELVQSMNELLPSLAALQQVMKNLSDMMTVAESEEKNLQVSEAEDGSAVAFASLEQKVEYLMPDLIGQSLRKSLRLLNQKEVAVTLKGTGVVVSQNPEPGTLLKKGDVCELNLAAGSRAVR